MRRAFLKLTVAALTLVLPLCLLCSCGSGEESEPTPEITAEEAAKAAKEKTAGEAAGFGTVTIEVDGRTITMEDAAGKSVRQLLDEVGITLEEGDLLTVGLDQVATEGLRIQILRGYSAQTVTIEADGKQISIEDTKGKTMQQLVEEAGITLNPGDVLALGQDQAMTGNLVIRVLRKCTVSVVVAEEDLSYTVVLAGGTVSDAIAAVGIQLAENQTVEPGLGDALQDGMEIIITTIEEEEEEWVEEPASSWEAPSGSGDGGSGSASTTPEAGTGTQTQPETPSETQPEAPPETTPPEEEIYVVSEVRYEDCDGSGHGVLVITYSDGTQEEVPY